MPRVMALTWPPWALTNNGKRVRGLAVTQKAHEVESVTQP